MQTPLCQRTRKHGSPCQSVATHGVYCAHYAKTATPKLEPVPAADEIVNSDDEPVQPAPAESRRPPENVRAQLAEDAAAQYDLVVSSLLETLQAYKTMMRRCSGCGLREPVQIPDATARVKAVEALLNQGLGRPPDPNRGDGNGCERCAGVEEADLAMSRDVKDMPDEELNALIDKLYWDRKRLLEVEGRDA